MMSCKVRIISSMPLVKYDNDLSIQSSLLLVTCLLGCEGQRPRLLSSVPSNSIEPVSQWVWGKLLNGQVYRSKSTFGGPGGGKSAIRNSRLSH